MPDKFVLKTNHDSHGVIICKNKKLIDIPKTIKTLKSFIDSKYWKQIKEVYYEGDINRFLNIYSNSMVRFLFFETAKIDIFSELVQKK